MINKCLKIGVVIDQLLAGGVQMTAIEQVKHLRKMGHDARLLILMRKKYPVDFSYLVKGIPYQYLSDSYPKPFSQTIKFPIFSFFSTLHLLSPILAPRVIKKKDYDILISHGTTTCLTTQALWRKRKIPYLAVIHDPIFFILKKVYSQTFLRFFFPFLIPLSYYLEKSFVKESQATIIDSDVHQKLIQEKYQVEPVILPLGGDISDKIHSKRGSSILAVSRWQKEKNPQLLLKILEEIPKARLIMAGVWTNQNDLQSFQKEVKKLGLEARVKVISQFEKENLPVIFKQARVWVHPNFEAFGMGGIEAASFGCPIIIPAGSGVTNLFQDGIDGFFPKKITVSEYKKFINRLLDDEKLAFKMGKNAWLRVKKEYSWEAHTQKLLFLIDNKKILSQLPKITAIELGHAGGTGLSGGDRLFEEMGKRMPEPSRIEVITPPFGSSHWKQANLKIILTILKPNPFEGKPDPISVFFSYVIRIIQASFSLLNRNKKIEILYSSTNILPDVLPAFITKIGKPKVSWIARIHHLIPPPPQREGRLIVNIVSYLMQKLALFCMRTNANITIALNETLYHHLLKIGFPKNKLAVLGAGIDFKEISQHQPKKVQNFDGIFLGRLHVTKGIFDTIDIWKKVVKKNKKAKLGIIGAGPEDIQEKFKTKIKKNGLSKNIKVLGYLPKNQVLDHLKSAKIFLFTDHEAGWGLAIAEAMACGLPVVGYDIGVLGDVFKKGYLKVKCFKTTDFAKKIVSLLGNENERKKLAQEAFAEAKNLSWEETTKKFEQMLDRLLNSNSK